MRWYLDIYLPESEHPWGLLELEGATTEVMREILRRPAGEALVNVYPIDETSATRLGEHFALDLDTTTFNYYVFPERD